MAEPSDTRSTTKAPAQQGQKLGKPAENRTAETRPPPRVTDLTRQQSAPGGQSKPTVAISERALAAAATRPSNATPPNATKSPAGPVAKPTGPPQTPPRPSDGAG